MQTNLAPEFQNTPDGDAAQPILRQCVHCGFCTATCPTYQLLGHENDGPRGRIYLIKAMLEGGEVGRSTQQHLDRCLTCRSCESTCPSGVPYAQLLEIGREVVDHKVPRPAGERLVRWALREGLTSPIFGPALSVGQAMRPLLPAALKRKVPAKAGPQAHRWPTRQHPRKVMMLMGCVQPAMYPNINSATARVLDAIGIQTVVAEDAGCCGAVRLHLGDRAGALDDMRRNIDAWWPQVAAGELEAIVMNASACGATVKDYGHSLAHDPDYAERAARISALTQDLSECLNRYTTELTGLKVNVPDGVVGYHPPCTLQHGQKLKGGVEQLLSGLGFDVHLPVRDSHLCCGSAGTYALLQSEISEQLRDRKVQALTPLNAKVWVSANLGCIGHLQAASPVPVKHWVELLDECLGDGAGQEVVS